MLFQSIRLLPSIGTPPSQWLDMPLAAFVPHGIDAAGTEYGRDLVLTEGFWSLAISYVVLRFVTRRTIRALHKRAERIDEARTDDPPGDA